MYTAYFKYASCILIAEKMCVKNVASKICRDYIYINICISSHQSSSDVRRINTYIH